MYIKGTLRISFVAAKTGPGNLLIEVVSLDEGKQLTSRELPVPNKETVDVGEVCLAVDLSNPWGEEKEHNYSVASRSGNEGAPASSDTPKTVQAPKR